MMRRGVGNSITREEQLRNWKLVRAMDAQGCSLADILAAATVSLPTVLRYRASAQPPRPRACRGVIAVKRVPRVALGRKRTRGQTQGVFSVHPKVAELRDQLIAAYAQGDMTEHGRLVIAMERLLASLKKAPAPVAVQAPTLLLEAAE